MIASCYLSPIVIHNQYNHNHHHDHQQHHDHHDQHNRHNHQNHHYHHQNVDSRFLDVCISAQVLEFVDCNGNEVRQKKIIICFEQWFHCQVLQLGSTVKLSEESIRTILSRWDDRQLELWFRFIPIHVSKGSLWELKSYLSVAKIDKITKLFQWFCANTTKMGWNCLKAVKTVNMAITGCHPFVTRTSKLFELLTLFRYQVMLVFLLSRLYESKSELSNNLFA